MRFRGPNLPRNCETISGTKSREFLFEKFHGAGDSMNLSGPEMLCISRGKKARGEGKKGASRQKWRFLNYLIAILYELFDRLEKGGIGSPYEDSMKDKRRLTEVFLPFLFEAASNISISFRKASAALGSNWVPTFFLISSQAMSKLMPFR